MREESSTKRMEAIAAMNEGLSAFLAASKKNISQLNLWHESPIGQLVLLFSVSLSSQE